MGPIRVVVAPRLADAVPDYLSQRSEDVERLHDALARRDFGAIEQLGRVMRESGPRLGFTDLVEIGGALELAAKNGDAGGAAHTAAILASWLDRLEVVFERT
jgi:HPt (histidine-containing phosphotransfer) domain-containing protein